MCDPSERFGAGKCGAFAENLAALRAVPYRAAMRIPILLFALASALAGCAPPSAAQKLNDAALDMGNAVRFGRMDVAMSYVAASSRDAYVRQHASWGSRVRVIDVEFGGARPLGENEAEVYMNVSWQRADEAHVRVTSVSQRWRDDRGTWSMVQEQTRGGDPGLHEEPKPPGEEAKAPQQRSFQAQFRTRVIPGE